MMINYELAILIAVFSFVYTNLLTDEEQIFNGLYNLLDTRLKGRWRWVFHVVIHCEKCFAGQFSFWLYIVLNFKNYQILNHLFFVTFTILMAEFIKQIHKKIKQNK